MPLHLFASCVGLAAMRGSRNGPAKSLYSYSANVGITFAGIRKTINH